jgi:predicted DNA-binding antitoxin AbrB/MazE fold protein
MLFRIFQVTTLALLLCVGGSAMAADAVKDNTHDGKVVSITNDTLVMTASQDGKEHSHTFGRDATLTLDGKACKAVDLKAGTRIRVTTRGADQKVATKIEGIDQNDDFASASLRSVNLK